MTESTSCSATHPRPSRAPSSNLQASYGLFIDGEFVDRSRRGLQDDQSGHRRGARRGHRRRPARRRPRRRRGPAGLRHGLGSDARARAREVPLPDRPDHPGARAASSPSSNRSTTASRSKSRATSTSLWSPHTSSTTRAGPTSSRTPASARPAARRRRPGHPVELPAADAGLEDRARRWPRATPSSSSRPRPLR